jgi:hypothetical protein
MSSPVAQSRSTLQLRGQPGAVEKSAPSSNDGPLAESVTEFIVRYPGATLASAFLAGVVIAWWIKRR